MPVREATASGSVNLVLKHEKNNVTVTQVSASPCFVKLHEQCFKICVIMKMNGLSKSGSHSTGHHNQSDGLVRFGKPWVCRQDRKWTRGKRPVREKWRSNKNGGGRYAWNNSVVRKTYSRMIASDVDQRAGGDSSPPRHESRRDSNPLAKSRMALHSFIPNHFAAEYAFAIS